MPAVSDIELRNRSLIAFTILTGARDGAIASLKMKHINLVERVVHQDARDVRTKASKSFRTWFFPVGGDALEIFTDYCQHLRDKLLWGNDDPLFPATLIAIDESGGFAPCGLRRENWKSAGPIREIFKAAFEEAGLPYFNPHSFRNTLVQLGERTCTTAETFKAWSQNLGHEQVLTTFSSYGSVAPHRQAELIRGLGINNVQEPASHELKELMAAVAKLHGISMNNL
jgi:integrase